MRMQFELTEKQCAYLLKASFPTPVMYLAGGRPMFSSPQENANRAWKALDRELGFSPLTVEPVPGKGQRFFTAEVSNEPK